MLTAASLQTTSKMKNYPKAFISPLLSEMGHSSKSPSNFSIYELTSKPDLRHLGYSMYIHLITNFITYVIFFYCETVWRPLGEAHPPLLQGRLDTSCLAALKSVNYAKTYSAGI